MTAKKVDAVSLNLPILIGLNTLTKYRMYVDNLQDRLCLPDANFEAALSRKNRHIYLEWPRSSYIRFTR